LVEEPVEEIVRRAREFLRSVQTGVVVTSPEK
jgi:hypothetical protein